MRPQNTPFFSTFSRLVLAAHLGNYPATFGGHIAESDGAAFTIGDNEPELLGVIAANAWNDPNIDAANRAQHGGETGHKHNQRRCKIVKLGEDSTIARTVRFAHQTIKAVLQ